MRSSEKKIHGAEKACEVNDVEGDQFQAYWTYELMRLILSRVELYTLYNREAVGKEGKK